jgi:hypothetical protein
MNKQGKREEGRGKRTRVYSSRTRCCIGICLFLLFPLPSSLPSVFFLFPLSARADPLFSDAERTRLVDYWSRPGRYKIDLPPDAAVKGPWQVRLTTDGSAWFLKYQIAIGAAKAPPTQDATATAPTTAAWETWVQAKLAYDRWKAQTTADANNAAAKGEEVKKTETENAAAPPDPGPIPPDLQAAAGDPPPFAAAVKPMQYTVTFDDGDIFSYVDNVVMRPRFAYYRFSQGTVALGKVLRDMPDSELEALFTAAGMTPSEQHIAKAVSRLEGGFESVNTYDTGFVSIGFIQFITLDDGRHSLSEVLAREKADHPDAFERDFHRFGLDVTAEGVIAVVDPAGGQELVGPEAVRKIIDDKRLTAIFQKAGRRTPFRVAQIQVAKSHYWPADDPIAITVGGKMLTGKVSDVVTSEAGLATLFDRKVNRGRIDPFADVLTKVMTAHNLTALADAAAYEQEIITGCRYRVDFLADKTLSQPKPPPEKPAAP